LRSTAVAVAASGSQSSGPVEVMMLEIAVALLLKRPAETVIVIAVNPSSPVRNGRCAGGFLDDVGASAHFQAALCSSALSDSLIR
jgi:hypothetical protein